MKKIGLIDYYISEWHAENYPAWIRAAAARLGLDYEVAYAWAEQDVSPLDGVSTEQWCAAQGITRCQTAEELCEKSDHIIVLAPSNPEVHLRLSEVALAYGKRCFIDKTFAPDLPTAQQIFALGERYGSPFFTSSALRFAEELKAFEGADNLFITCGGNGFDEYIVHPAEMCVAVLGGAAERVRTEAVGEQRFCRVVMKNGKQAMLLVSPAIPNAVAGQTAQGHYRYNVIESDIFGKLLEKTLTFFEDGTIPFDTAQTVEVMRLRDALIRAEAANGDWVAVE